MWYEYETRLTSPIRGVCLVASRVAVVAVAMDIKEQLYRIRPRTIVYLFSGGRIVALPFY